MKTTIQVSNQTRHLLEILKERKKAKSLNIVIKNLAEKEAKIPKSMFGIYPDLKPWKKETDRPKSKYE